DDAFRSPNSLLVSTDGSVPYDSSLSSTSAYLVFDQSSSHILSSRVLPNGRSTSSDSESYALCLGLFSSISLSQERSFSNILFFTDSIASAKRLFDYSPHSAHPDSIKVAPLIRSWLAASTRNKLHFWAIPSTAKWSIHRLAHNLATSLRVPNNPAQPFRTTTGYLRKQSTDFALMEWKCDYERDPSYKGHHFMEHKDQHGAFLQPSYINGGTWLSTAAGQDANLCARMTRCITNHAPIGSFRQRFFPGRYVNSCPCGAELETREHIIQDCPLYERHQRDMANPYDNLAKLIEFLEDNPSAFSFANKPEGPVYDEWQAFIIKRAERRQLPNGYDVH
ncbi:hypothetical protein P691DRAFT_681062, partial [Macrolepiota fuliginosa MF-IS2]